MKKLISMLDVSKDEIERIMKLSDELKDKKFERKNEIAALLFNRPSTRTLVSFVAALEQLGYGTVHLDYTFTQLIRGERLKDAAKTLSQYASLIVARLTPHEMLTEAAEASSVPVINAATDIEHPCQALGDLYTMQQLGKLKKSGKIVFVGDPNDNVANSLMIGTLKLGMNFTFLAPRGYEPNKFYLNEAKKTNSAGIEVTNEIKSAAKDASVIYASPWVRETIEEESSKRMKEFLPYQINEEMLKLAPKDAIVMHPLPAFRGLEISESVLDGKQSVVWKQAKNRMYVQKAIVKMLVED